MWAVCQHRRTSLVLKRKKAWATLCNLGNLTAQPTETPWRAHVKDVNMCTCMGETQKRSEGSVQCGSVGGNGEGSLDLTGAILLIQNNSCKVGMKGRRRRASRAVKWGELFGKGKWNMKMNSKCKAWWGKEPKTLQIEEENVGHDKQGSGVGGGVSHRGKNRNH